MFSGFINTESSEDPQILLISDQQSQTGIGCSNEDQPYSNGAWSSTAVNIYQLSSSYIYSDTNLNRPIPGLSQDEREIIMMPSTSTGCRSVPLGDDDLYLEGSKTGDTHGKHKGKKRGNGLPRMSVLGNQSISDDSSCEPNTQGTTKGKEDEKKAKKKRLIIGCCIACGLVLLMVIIIPCLFVNRPEGTLTPSYEGENHVKGTGTEGEEEVNYYKEGPKIDVTVGDQDPDPGCYVLYRFTKLPSKRNNTARLTWKKLYGDDGANMLEKEEDLEDGEYEVEFSYFCNGKYSKKTTAKFEICSDAPTFKFTSPFLVGRELGAEVETKNPAFLNKVSLRPSSDTHDFVVESTSCSSVHSSNLELGANGSMGQVPQKAWLYNCGLRSLNPNVTLQGDSWKHEEPLQTTGVFISSSVESDDENEKRRNERDTNNTAIAEVKIVVKVAGDYRLSVSDGGRTFWKDMNFIPPVPKHDSEGDEENEDKIHEVIVEDAVYLTKDEIANMESDGEQDIVIRLPPTMEAMEDGVFDGLGDVTSIVIGEDNGEGGKYFTKNGILYDGETGDLVRCPEGYTGTAKISTDHVREGAFAGCSKVDTLEIDRVNCTFAENVFKGCGEMKLVINGLTSGGIEFTDNDNVSHKYHDRGYVPLAHFSQEETTPMTLSLSFISKIKGSENQSPNIKLLAADSSLINNSKEEFGSETVAAPKAENTALGFRIKAVLVDVGDAKISTDVFNPSLHTHMDKPRIIPTETGFKVEKPHCVHEELSLEFVKSAVRCERRAEEDNESMGIATYHCDAADDEIAFKVVVTDSFESSHSMSFVSPNPNTEKLTLAEQSLGVVINCGGVTDVFIEAGVDAMYEGVEGSDVGSFDFCNELEWIEVDQANKVYKSSNGWLFDRDYKHLIRYPPASIVNPFVIPSPVEVVHGHAFIGRKNPLTIKHKPRDHSLFPTNITELEAAGVISVEAETTAEETIRRPVAVAPKSLVVIELWNLKEDKLGWNEQINGRNYEVRFSDMSLVFMAPELKEEGDNNIVIGSQESDQPVITIPVIGEGGGVVDGEGTLIIPDGTVTIPTLPPTVGENNSVSEGDQEEQEEQERDDIKRVVLPDSTDKIEDRAFVELPYIESVVAPEGLMTIGSFAFAFTNLKSFSVPSTVSSIGTNPFAGCVSLEKLESKSDNYVVHGAALISRGSELISYACGFKQEDSSFQVPTEVAEIGAYAFYGCPSLTNASVIFQSWQSIKSIGDYSFGKTSVGEVMLPNSLVSVGKFAFYHCDLLKTVCYEGSEQRPSVGQDAFWEAGEVKALNSCQ